MGNGLLLRGKCIVIPQQLQKETLKNINISHQGMKRCQQWMSTAVWWPRITSQLHRVLKTEHTPSPAIAANSAAEVSMVEGCNGPF